MKYVALLRAINVGGRNMVAMSDLRDLLGDLGFADVRTLLQSGNLVFDGPRKANAALQRQLETALEKELGIAVDFLVRTGRELKCVIDQNPFPTEAASDPGHLLVIFLKQAPTAASVRELAAAIRGPETVRAVGQQLYAVYPAGTGRSKLTNALIEQKLATRGTGRNWNTVLKLAALADE